MTPPKLVLIVEDTDDIGMLIKIAIEVLGLKAHHANTPDQALTFLKT